VKDTIFREDLCKGDECLESSAGHIEQVICSLSHSCLESGQVLASQPVPDFANRVDKPISDFMGAKLVPIPPKTGLVGIALIKVIEGSVLK